MFEECGIGSIHAGSRTGCACSIMLRYQFWPIESWPKRFFSELIAAYISIHGVISGCREVNESTVFDVVQGITTASVHDCTLQQTAPCSRPLHDKPE